jgi:exonuclease VII small subunit
MGQKELDEARVLLDKAGDALRREEHPEHLEARFSAAIQKLMEHVKSLEAEKPEEEK